MPNTPLQAHPALLLIEPDTLGYAERAAQLSGSQFCVTRADDLRDVYLMRNVFNFGVAVLSDTLGLLALRASAQMVRGQWPKARIVLLGEAPRHFDDNLYDESIVHGSNGSAFLEVLEKVTEEPGSGRSHDAYAAWLVRVSSASRLLQSAMVQESDPTKVSGPVREARHARDWPAAEQMRQAVR